MKRTAATIISEFGPFPGVTHVHGVSYDGTNIWIATGDTLNAIDAASGKTVRALDVPAHAGTAFDPFENTEGGANEMISRSCQGVPVWSISSNLVSISGPPSEDPQQDDDENEEDENDEGEKDEEPAVIREPDEC